MDCPFCKIELMVDRTEKYESSVSRIRRCPECGRRWKVHEDFSNGEPYHPSGLNYKDRVEWYKNMNLSY